MSLTEHGFQAGGHPNLLTKVRLKLTDAGDIILIGTDRFGFSRQLLNPRLFRFDTQYIHLRDEPKYNYICFFNQFDFERPWIPSERVPRVTPKDKSWGAIYDLLAEASLCAFRISGVVPYDELIDKYGEENYQTVNMEEITDIVTKAVRKE